VKITWRYLISKIYCFIKPVSLFPTPVGPEIARTSGFDNPIFLLNSQEAIEFVMALTAAVCPAIAFGKLVRIDKNLSYTFEDKSNQSGGAYLSVMESKTLSTNGH
jgi:hypothetical protein